MWISINKVLPITLKKLGLEKEIDKSAVFKNWKKIITDRYQIKTTPYSYKQGVLIISCRNSVLANELSFKEKTFLKELNKKKELVKKIKFVCE